MLKKQNFNIPGAVGDFATIVDIVGVVVYPEGITFRTVLSHCYCVTGVIA